MESGRGGIRISVSLLIFGIFMFIPTASHAQIELIGSCEIPYSVCFIEVQGEFAFVSGWGQTLGVIDISDPTSPHIIANYDTAGAPWGTGIYGGYAFIANGPAGLAIIDITEPFAPTFTGSFAGLDLSHAVVAKKNTVYLQSCKRLYSIDISDPSDPHQIDSIFTYLPDSRGLFVENDYAYTIRIGNSGLQIIDITDSTDLELRGTYSNLYLPNVIHIDLIVHNGFAYIPTFRGLQIINVMDPDNPGFAGSYDSTLIGDRICYGDNYLFLTRELQGFRILDISNPVSPVLVVHYEHSGYGYWDISYRDGLIYALDARQLDIFAFGPLEIEGENEIPDKISYLNAFPNPFNPSTAISYSLPESGEVTLSIYNLLGQRVDVLFDGSKTVGSHSITWDASDFPSGVYFARLKAGGKSENIKMVLLK